MIELALELDNIAKKSIDDLMSYYNINNRAAVIQKAISLLKVAAHIEKTNGELFARKGEKETRIIVR